VRSAFTVRERTGRTIATAIHAGHDLRPELEGLIAIDASTRRREEDPCTDRFTEGADIAVAAHRSRFEFDLNRPRAQAVYRTPDDAWGLECWRRELPDDVVERSLELYDSFYAEMARTMDRLARRGTFLVLDIHSYNHRRDGPSAAPAPQASNPDVNVGTGSLDRTRWKSAVDRFIATLGRQEVDGHPIDVRENVRFRGGYFPRWVNERYAGTGCALAVEFKKTFMDEWSVTLDHARLEQLVRALWAAVPSTLAAMDPEAA
jgi:N-formylglutamate amidohydrolase